MCMHAKEDGYCVMFCCCMVPCGAKYIY